jgi:hypothetical protein
MRGDKDIIFESCIAEYNTITSRNTYYMYVSFSFWVALVAFLTLLVILRGTINDVPMIVGLGALGSEVFAAG